MSGERSSSERKRVRFRDEADIRESPASEIGARKKPRRDVMTVERLHTVHDDPMFALEGKITESTAKLEVKPPLQTEHEHHEKEEEHEEEEDDDDDGGVAADWDVFQNAEEDYEDPDERFNDAGIPIEPFNLKQEREEGYFDKESGSYIQLKKKDDVDDAWADALAREEVDVDWARKIMAKVDRRMKNGSTEEKEEEEEEVVDLSADEIIELKKKIIAFLQPGEDVLAALRRLGQEREPVATEKSSKSGKKKSGRRSAVKQKHSSTASELVPAARREFDQLTEWSTQLMEAGEFLIHSQTREELIAALDKQQQQKVDDGGGEETAKKEDEEEAEEGGIKMELSGEEEEETINGEIQSSTALELATQLLTSATTATTTTTEETETVVLPKIDGGAPVVDIENKGCCAQTKNTGVFPICRIGPRSPFKIAKELKEIGQTDLRLLRFEEQYSQVDHLGFLMPEQ